MDKRENLIRALRRKNPEYVPHGFLLCESLEKTFKKKTGFTDYMEYFEMPHRFIDFLPTIKPNDYSRYYSYLPEGAVIDEWGVAYIPSGTEHFCSMMHPMESFVSPEQVWEFPLPDILEDYRWEGYAKKVKDKKEAGLATVNYYAIQIFEPAWYLRGMENLLADMLCDEEMAKACLDKMTQVKSKMSEKLALAGLDMIIFGDDVGAQKAMMMNPELWRKWLKPTMKTAIEAAKNVNPDVICYYHSDGVIYDIIPDLIEIGVDVLNPIQPECMDPIKIKNDFGDKISFWGTIGTQTTMPFGTPYDVEASVKLMIETVGKGGGFVVAPTHIIEPEVPWENIEAFVSAVKRFGRY